MEAIFAKVQRHQISAELIIVDDNSPDGTGEIAESLKCSYQVRVIHRSGKLGLATAVLEGISAARHDLIAVMDADLSHPPSLVPQTVEAVQTKGYDLVIASRYVPGGEMVHWPLKRKAMSRIACLLARPLTPIKDATSGFFMMKGSVIEGTALSPLGFKICLEIIVRGNYESFLEMPYSFTDRKAGESKLGFNEVIQYLRQLYFLYWDKITRRV